MSAILVTVIPVFVLIALGFSASRFRLFSKEAAAGLNQFVYYFAVPALLFRTMLKVDIAHAVPWALWGSYYFGIAAIWLFVLLGAKRLGSLGEAGGAATALSASFGNLVLMGLPLGYLHFGEEALIPAALIIAIHAPVQWFVGTICAEWTHRNGGKTTSAVVLEFARNIMLNPIIASLGLGFLWNLTGMGLNPAVDKVITLLGQGAVPTALFALGLSIAGYSFKGQTSGVFTILVLKMAIFPAITWVLAVKLFALSPISAGIVILFAAMPPGVNAYLFASRYQASVAAVTGAIALGTAVAVFTVPILLWWLGAPG